MNEFSCLISCYKKDSPHFLKEALSSISAQSTLPKEVVFVEDGKLTEELYDVLNEFEDELPLKRISLKENKGLGNALNIGLLQCSFNIVMRMDADDICCPKRFEKQLTFLQEYPNVDIVGTWAKDIDIEGNVKGDRKYPTGHDELYKLVWSNPLIHPSVAFRRDAILKIGSYNTKIVRRQDYDLWLRAAYHGLKFANIPEFLLYYRFTESYYKKNGSKVAWEQAIMGIKGISKLKVPKYAYLAVFVPVIRSIFPKFMIKRIHQALGRFDPRKKIQDYE